MRIGKEYYFDAAHMLPNHKGKCSRLHGHSYKVEVEISGDINTGNSGLSNEGMVLDFDILGVAMSPIIEALDHYYLNDVMEEVTTAENVARYIHKYLGHNLMQMKEWADLQNSTVERVRVYEGRKAYAEWP